MILKGLDHHLATSQARGEKSEERVADAIETLPDDWIVRVRRMPQHSEADHEGTDIIVETWRGDIRVQVKSRKNSLRVWARRMRKKDPKRLDGLVMIATGDRTFDDLRKDIGEKLTAAYMALPDLAVL